MGAFLPILMCSGSALAGTVQLGMESVGESQSFASRLALGSKRISVRLVGDGRDCSNAISRASLAGTGAVLQCASVLKVGKRGWNFGFTAVRYFQYPSAAADPLALALLKVFTQRKTGFRRADPNKAAQNAKRAPKSAP